MNAVLCALLALSAQDRLKTGAAAYDNHPEPLRSELVKEWRAELEALKRAIRADEELARKARTIAEKQRLERVIAQYKEKLSRHEKNDPPFLNKARVQPLVDARLRKLTEGLSDFEKKYAEDRVKGERLPFLDVDEKHFLAAMKTGQYGTLRVQGGVQVRQVISQREILAAGQGATGHEQGPFWIEGISTTDLTDGALVDVDRLVFVVAGTKSYKAVGGGTKTVKRFLALDTAKIDKILSDAELQQLLRQLRGG